MDRPIVALLKALVMVAVPLLLVGNMLWVLAQPWLVPALYALPGIPDPMTGVSIREQADLAVAGVRAIQPAGDGVGILREARLPDGSLAFVPREVTHMDDVRSVVGAFVGAWALAVVAIVAAVLTSRRTSGRGRILRWLARGAWVTLAAMIVLGVGMLVAFDAFFVAFHGVFFEGGSWRFGPDSTLLKLYPEAFWSLAGGLAVALVVVQALALVLLARRRAGAGAASRQPAAVARAAV